MKYLILFSLILFLTTGCFHKDEDNSQANMDNQQQEETQKEAKNLQASKTMDESKIDPAQFEDLVAKYTGAKITTNFGPITVKFYNQESPKTVNNFLNLAEMNFYNKTKFHRVIKDFMIQGGDPNSRDDDWSNDGTGGPGYKFEDEINNKKLVKGSLAMANSGPNTNGSQFFIVTAESTPWLDGRHTNFGEVTEGLAVVEKIENVSKDQRDHPTQDVIIESIKLIK